MADSVMIEDAELGRPFIAALVLSKARDGLPAGASLTPRGAWQAQWSGGSIIPRNRTECGPEPGVAVDASCGEQHRRTACARSAKGEALPGQAISSLFLKEFVSAFFLSMGCFFAPKKTLNHPFEKGPLSPRLRGEHALRRYPNGQCRELCLRSDISSQFRQTA
jgi:hypothetical protein